MTSSGFEKLVILFISREYDGETGLYYYRARYYGPLDGRFISRDPIGLAGGINQYAYTGNSPINRKDPSHMGFTMRSVNWTGLNYHCAPYS
jgi:RHS repeat-associated protein